MLLGPEFFGRAEVPFSRKEGGVSFLFEGLGEGCFVVIETIVERSAGEFATASSAEEIGAILAGGIAAGLDSEAGGGADRVGRVAVGEFQT